MLFQWSDFYKVYYFETKCQDDENILSKMQMFHVMTLYRLINTPLGLIC